MPCLFVAWIEDLNAAPLWYRPAIAAGLEQDAGAVRAALVTPWSSGQAEGQINPPRVARASMYGRASFELLRRRVLLAA